jgi:hypothetical protein
MMPLMLRSLNPFALLDETRAVEIAGDMFRLYELLAGLRTDDGYGQWKWR